MASETSKRNIKKTNTSSNTQIKKITHSEECKPSFYLCCTCKKQFTKLDGNFPASQSEIYAGLDYHLPICKTCLDNMFIHYTEVYGNNEDKAIRRICELFDIYYNESLLNSSRKITKDRSRIHTYISRANLAQYKDKTYDTTLDEEKNKSIASFEDLDSLDEKDAKKKRKNMLRWGLDYSGDEYEMLNGHYDLYKDGINENDASQVTLLNDLCEQYILKCRARMDKDIDKYDKISKLYQQTLNNANLKVKGQNDTGNNADDTWGSFIKIIENYCPADYFKDKEIFKDYDEMDEYYRRFINRPVNNLINGTTDMDEEFCIKDDDTDD